jgi:hypothetical protein
MYALVEYARFPDGTFRPGGVAVEGGEIRYRDDNDTFTTVGAAFRNAVEYLRSWYGIDGAAPPEGYDQTPGPSEIDSWKAMFGRMDSSSNNGYTFMRYLVQVPDGSTADELFDWYVIRGEQGQFKKP